MASGETFSVKDVRIILCGKSLENGSQVTQLVKPEFEVVHFINSFGAAKRDFGDLISGRSPATANNNDIGTHNYGQPLNAIIFGRAFDPDHVLELNESFRGKGETPIAWIAGDPTVKPPKVIPTGYPEKAADNVKRAYSKWLDEGATSEDIVYY